MLALLPIFCFISLFLSFLKILKKDEDWRVAFILSSTVWGLLVVFGVELLNIFSAIRLLYVAGFWSITTLLSMGLFWALPASKEIKLSFSFKKLSFSEIFLVSSVALIVFILAVTAFVAPPNNSDAMVYHMSRVAHWIQNSSVEHYPTPILKQLWKVPWAEYAIMHFQILAQSDRWANGVQFFSMAGSLVASSLIAKIFGVASRGQLLTALVVATIPMGILQASSTQNDYVVSFWLICFVYFLLTSLAQPAPLMITASACNLGLAFLTKETSYIYAFPFMVWFAVSSFKRCQWKAFQYLFIFFVCIFLINIWHYWDNYILFKNILSPDHQDGLTNTIWSVRATLSNIVRNVALEMVTPFENLNNWLIAVVSLIHRFLGIDINDPRTTFAFPFSFIQENARHTLNEQVASNALHTLFTLGAVSIFIFSPQLRALKILQYYFLAVLFAFVIFNFYLRWSLFNGRVLLPLFVLISPFIVKVFDKEKGKSALSLGVVFFTFSLPWLFLNEVHPLVGKKSIFSTPRFKQYFTSDPGYYYSFAASVKHIKETNCQEVGLLLGEDYWEYPLWAAFNGHDKKPFRLEHIHVANVSKQIPTRDFYPCALIDSKKEQKISKIMFEGRRFVKSREFLYATVFLLDTTGDILKQSLNFYLNDMFKYSNEAFQILFQGKKKTLSMEDVNQMMDLRRKELESARFIDADDLNSFSNGLGDHFQEELVLGLELLTEGFDSKNKEKYKKGELLILKWHAWLRQNTQELNKVFNLSDGPSVAHQE